MGKQPRQRLFGLGFHRGHIQPIVLSALLQPAGGLRQKGKQQGLTAGSAPNVMKRKLVPVAQEEDRRLRTSGSCGAKAELLLKIETVHMLERINPPGLQRAAEAFLIMGGKGEKRNGVFTALLRRHQFPGGRQSGDRDPAYSARFL